MEGTAANRRSVLRSLTRLWWGGLFALHVPAFWAVWSSLITEGPDPSRLGSGIALALAMAFFVLKFRDFALLRLRTRQQSIVVVCLLTAVVHHQAIAPGGEGMVAVPAMATVYAVGEVIRLRPPAPGRFTALLAAEHTARRLILAATTGADRDAWLPSPRQKRPPSDPRGPPA